MFVFPVASPFRLRVSHHFDRATFPVPATSNAACGFPTLRSPACFTSRVMGPILLGRLSAEATEPLLNSFKVSYSHCLLHRVQPKPFRFRALIRWRRIFFSTQS